jgi:peptidyl-prolyl cis-trans isomerase D
LPKGSISDLIVAPYGIHILQVVDREQARTRTFEEVRETLRPELAEQKLERAVAQMGDRLAAEVRQSSRRPIEELAAAVGLPVRTTDFFALGEPMNSLGSAEQLQQAVFRLRPGELSAPVLTERGYAVFAVREIQPARQGTLNDAEIRRRVAEDFRRERAIQLARTRAEELARRAQSGESFAAAARALGFTPQTSEPITRSESIPGLGSGRELAAAFSIEPGRTGAPVQVGADWAVFRVVERAEADPAAFATQSEELRRQLLQNRRETAYEAFRRSLRERMTLEGKVEFNDENMRRMTEIS